MRTPEKLETARLVLRRPRPDDARAIFERYAGDPEVTRFMGWPRHESLADTKSFLAFSDTAWEHWQAGPYLILKRDGALLGSTGLEFETPYRAMTGYVLARDAWGQGHATEALSAVADLAPRAGVERLYAVCHTEHQASRRVLEKCGFVQEGILRRYLVFPNLAPGVPADVLCYARTSARN